MESTTELILHGHFSRLRESVNKQSDSEAQKNEMLEVFKQVFNYFSEQERQGMLDAEGKKICNVLTEYFDYMSLGENVAVPGKLPMQKAKGKRSAEDKKKTGT